MTTQENGAPLGTPYDWFRRASEFLAHGEADASLLLIDRVLAEEPDSRSAREVRARALFDARHYPEAVSEFHLLVELAPDDDYAHYGLGMSLWRTQQFREAENHLAMAAVMRPDRHDYGQALAQVRATLRARREAGLPLEGPVNPTGPAILGIDTWVAGPPPEDPA